MLSAMIAVVTFDGLLGDRIQIDGAVRADFHTSAMTTAGVVVDCDGSPCFLVQGAARASLEAWRLLAVLARHRQEQASYLRMLTCIFVNGLSNVIAQGDIVFRLAANLASVAAKAATRIHKPA